VVATTDAIVVGDSTMGSESLLDDPQPMTNTVMTK
jgi:hypothetical protein